MLLKTDFKKQFGAVYYEMGSTLLQNPPLWVDCSLKGHTPMYGASHIWWNGSRPGSIKRHGLSEISHQTLWSAVLAMGPYSWYSLRKSNWWTSWRGERKAVALSELLVHSKAGSLQVLWQSRENTWNSKISFNLENNPFDPFLSSCYIPHSCHSLHPMEHEFFEDNEYLSSLPADADRAEDFEYEVRSFSHHFTFLHKVMVKEFCIKRKN